MRSLSILLLGLLIPAIPYAGDQPQEVLDRTTGATLVLAAQPFVFARDEPQLAAHGRDYFSLYAVEINSAGQRRYYLVGFDWSTIDRRVSERASPTQWLLTLDDRRVALRAATVAPQDLGIGSWPLASPARGARMGVFAVDLAILRQLASAQGPTLRGEASGATDGEPLTLWREGRAALQAFLDR